MPADYGYSPWIWPMLAAAGGSGALAVYAWHRRAHVAAPALCVLAALGVPWALGGALEQAAPDLTTRLIWFRFHNIWQLPAAAATLWFALAYADLSRWPRPVFRRVLLPAFALFFLIGTVDSHHLIWETFSHGRELEAAPGALGALGIALGLVLSLTTTLVFLAVFVQSPANRLAAAICVGGQLVARAAYAIDAGVGGGPEAHLDLHIMAFPVTTAMYALALFRYHTVDLIPVARGTVIDQMQDGMLVLNTTQQILDLNPAAERMLGVSTARALGSGLCEVFPDCHSLLQAADQASSGDMALERVSDGATLHYRVHRSTLVHGSGKGMGFLLLLRDVTAQRADHERLIAQQRALAVLEERDRVARELHDSLGQVLGFVKMQAEAIRRLLRQDRAMEADSCLSQLVSAAQEAHYDVRDYILGARAGLFSDAPLISTLQRYIQQYSATYSIAAHLDVGAGVTDDAFDPVVATQLLRIIQEALSNVRKHAGAREVHVQLMRSENRRAQAVVTDNGVGFDPATCGASGKYGVLFMRERANEIGASIDIYSTPGEGARVVVTVPLAQEAYASAAG